MCIDIYICLDALPFCSESEKTILQNMYLRWPDCDCYFFPFSALYAVCQMRRKV